MYDILIKNCRIIDGSGAPWYRADVAVKGGKIVKIGHLCGQPGHEAENTVDGQDPVSGSRIYRHPFSQRYDADEISQS